MTHRIDQLENGMILSEDVYDESGELILSLGTVLSSAQIDRLEERGVLFVSIVVHSDDVNVNPVVAREAQIHEKYNDAVHRFKDVFQTLKFGNKIAYSDVEDIASPLVDEVMENTSIARQLWQLKTCDLYTFDHSVTVSLVSALLAKWLKFDEATVRDAAVAGLMHDIGKINIPDQILNKPSSLTAEEYKVMKTHATLGYVLLMNNGNMPHQVIAAVHHHHERYDGTGYPSGLVRNEIEPLTRIVAIADVFSAMTTHRVYKKAKNPFLVAKEMREASYGSLDPEYIQAFITGISNYYVGNVVKLSNHEVGEVIMIHKSEPHRPLVKVGDKFIDLIKDHTIDIEEVVF
ncbi:MULTISPECIES: HD-GYP domain-containing protein [unclassified Fusibacter]|uniref:HD-GYP domain-containing protein n=1 Tax=unclassified Fusibacter TaxID=2624464 RepID=UPI00101094D8|nr:MULTISPECIES: HD-GYP domain-containing protein [unclassified Fusibacter]MCK8061311.1 HD-GYP domain-containing protein [Fusibacter sp. A2]NPE23492.1 HD-GYP domain-containing protein [Fusibacter sp. A1]RXV59098.1 HD-GYP domain-containing protein [Fusibacter sp. A1]